LILSWDFKFDVSF